MSSIMRDGDTYHGISVDGRGVFKHDKYGRWTYAGQCRDGYACGLGVLMRSDGSKIYSEHGPDGKYDGRCLGRFTNGHTGHWLSERGERTDFAFVFADGTCEYNGEDCAPDDPRLLALIAQVAPVEVRPIDPAPATHTHKAIVRCAGLVCPRRRWRPPWPPRCTPTVHISAHVARRDRQLHSHPVPCARRPAPTLRAGFT
jgi:hypothetical protein